MVLGDGSTVSVQASQGHYCEPRRDGATAYSAVEVGFPRGPEGELWDHEFDCPELADYAEGDPAEGTVYAWVPVEVLQRVLDDHGGIVGQRGQH
jgi:hypothetical protein